MQRILVTGATGFIGTHLTKELRDAGYEVVGVDLTDGDLTNPGTFEALAKRHNPNIVVHLAAKVGRLYGEGDIADTITQNAIATALVARVCGERGIRLVYASTSEVYGDMGDDLRVEDGPMVTPYNIYGLSKRWGEEVCRLYAPDRLLMPRLSMPYGPRLSSHLVEGRAAIIQFLYNALHRRPIPVHKNSGRSWCWVGDAVRGIRMLIEQSRDGAWNVGRDDAFVSMRHVAELTCELTDAPKDLIVDVPPPANQIIVKRLSVEKLRSIGWKPEVSLEEGIKRTLAWVRTLPGPQ